MRDAGRDAGDYFTATYTPDVAELVSVGQSARRFTLTRWHRLMPFVAMIVGGALSFGYFFLFGELVDKLARPIVGRSSAALAVVAGLVVLIAPVVWFVARRLTPLLMARIVAERRPLDTLTVRADAETVRWDGKAVSTMLRLSEVERITILGSFRFWFYRRTTLVLSL